MITKNGMGNSISTLITIRMEMVLSMKVMIGIGKTLTKKGMEN